MLRRICWLLGWVAMAPALASAQAAPDTTPQGVQGPAMPQGAAEQAVPPAGPGAAAPQDSQPPGAPSSPAGADAAPAAPGGAAPDPSRDPGPRPDTPPTAAPPAAALPGAPPPEAPPAAPEPDPVPTVPPPEAEAPDPRAAGQPAPPGPAAPPQGHAPANGPAGAAQAPAPAEADPVPQAARETLPRAGLFRVLGQDVRGSSNNVVGQVVNVLVDQEGRPRVAVLDYGGFLGVGRRRIAVAWAALNFSPEGIRLGLGRDQLRAFPEYREGEDVTFALPPPARPVAGNPE
ncbi:PRC-barrel domain-containing protein [Pseudoroseomonas cervicalis]|uniref:PRC-barrel domain-containing protein n=1 Tax=Teichococcus cervicalis TaxID=204525 RepID=UPI002782A0B8|nr:PRC-barrel domain-containing protein [Pseudoroseomonas cervicalis]MDQ1078163.1 hypothetical protein [Pseudoroseomonas cervicalis]